MGGPLLTELAGRSEELSGLDDVLEATEAGRGSTVLIGGEAGVGKSRLVAEMCARAEARGYVVAVGRGTPIEGRSLPYGQVVPLLHELERKLGQDGGDVLAPAFDALGLSYEGDAHEAARRPTAGRFARTWLFEKLLRALSAVAGRSPTLLVFEDIHWADPGTIGVVDFVTRNIAASRLAIVCTHRTEEPDNSAGLEMLLTETALLPQVRALELGGLKGDDLTALVTGILGRPPDQRLLAALDGRSGGNPFFVQELMASGSPSEWSPTLRAAVARRLIGVSPQAMKVLGVASALTSSLDDELLASLCEFEDDTLGAALRECLERHLLVRSGDARTRYAFRHELLREAVYDALLPGQRTRIHRLVAEALRGRTDGTGAGYAEAELAGHWWAAGEWREALRSSMTAADAAHEVFAFEEAAIHLEHALACADRLGQRASGVDRTALLERAADIAYFAGSGEQSIALAHAVIEAVDADAEPLRAAMAYVRLARNQWTAADSVATLEALAAAEALIPDDPPTRELARTLAEKARYLMLTAHYREAESICQRALAVARAVGARSEESHVLATAGACQGDLGRHDEGVALLRTALAIAEELRSPEDMARAYSNLGNVLFVAGRLEEVAELAAVDPGESEDVAGIRIDNTALNGADALVELGRWADAEAMVGTASRHMGNCGNHPQMVRAVLAVRRGEFEDARRDLDFVLQATEKLQDVQFRGEALLRIAEMALAEGKPLEAFDAVDLALSTAAGTDDTQRMPEMCALGIRALADTLEEARARKRRHDEAKLRLLAAELVDQAGAVSGRVSEGGTLGPRAVAFIALCRAELTRLHTPDPAAWAEVTGHWKALGQRHHAAYTQWREAEALLALRLRRARAADLLRTAWRTCSELGARPLGQRVADLAQRARVTLDDESEERRRASERAENLGITARELEVLQCLADGKSDAQIAESLFISKKTASVHVSNLLRKLDAGSRYEAAEIAKGAGLPSR